MTATVMITGAGGFVGSGIARRLIPAAACGEVRLWDGRPVERVVALARPGSPVDRLEEIPPAAGWTLARVDLQDREELLRLLDLVRPSAVLHAALDRAVFTETSGEERRRLTLRPLENLFRGLSGTPGARLIHTGSAWVLRGGDALDEAAEVRPRSPYAMAKALEDAALPELQQATGVDWINLRLFNTFGKYEAERRLIPYLVSRLRAGDPAQLSHGNQVRDFNDVDRVSEAYLGALRAGTAACGRVYHIGTGRGMTLREFALAAAGVLEGRHLVRFGEAQTSDEELPCLVAAPRQARAHLGWDPQQDTESSVEGVVRWWISRYEKTRPVGGQNA